MAHFSAGNQAPGGGKITTTGVLRGDLNSSFTVKTDTVVSGSPNAQMNGERRTTVSAVWIGSCPPGARGGDITMPDGITRNILDDVARVLARETASAGDVRSRPRCKFPSSTPSSHSLSRRPRAFRFLRRI